MKIEQMPFIRPLSRKIAGNITQLVSRILIAFTRLYLFDNQPSNQVVGSLILLGSTN